MYEGTHSIEKQDEIVQDFIFCTLSVLKDVFDK